MSKCLISISVLGLHSNGFNIQQVLAGVGEMLSNGPMPLKSASVEKQEGGESKIIEQEAANGKRSEECSTQESPTVKVLENGDGPGVLKNASACGSAVGAYVHVTKINEAGKRPENLRKLFTRGKEVCHGMRYLL